MPNELAPPGSVWVCGACGKRSRDRYGADPIGRGWDVSCAIHAVLCREDSIVLDERGLVEAAGKPDAGDLAEIDDGY